ncbi:Uncharacterised protein [Yersinia similis]|uniref:Uncharacterized protein n=1 Tax=Yersinia similis TaxID=367190 RepID=A0A0T9RR31_9GAMM|nr:Uncharacterised protein [Yersinia similis]CNG66117.1 Uncharacterised protein [Yersinia similis]CNI78488.1 Uncharacterised protein [Yersinia similis]
MIREAGHHTEFALIDQHFQPNICRALPALANDTGHRVLATVIAIPHQREAPFHHKIVLLNHYFAGNRVDRLRIQNSAFQEA